jgi:hypothetical protein
MDARTGPDRGRSGQRKSFINIQGVGSRERGECSLLDELLTNQLTPTGVPAGPPPTHLDSWGARVWDVGISRPSRFPPRLRNLGKPLGIDTIDTSDSPLMETCVVEFG